MSNPTNLKNSPKNQGHVAIGMGSNLGESLDTLKNAIQTLDEIAGIKLITYSKHEECRVASNAPVLKGEEFETYLSV